VEVIAREEDYYASLTYAFAEEQGDAEDREP
jgi:hypothetical protein